MSPLLYAINVTANGRCDHRDVVADDELHHFYTRLIRNSDGVILGRKTYEMFFQFWPAVARTGKGTASLVGFARQLEKTPRYVVSKSLRTIKWPGTRQLAGPLRRELAKLKASGRKSLVVMGSAALARSIQRAGLFERYILVVQPMVSRRGPELFAEAKPVGLALTKTQRFKSGVTVLSYDQR